MDGVAVDERIYDLVIDRTDKVLTIMTYLGDKIELSETGQGVA